MPSILLAGVAALVIAVPTASCAFRLNGAYFAIGTGTSLPRDATRDMWFVALIEDALGVRSVAARDILAYWLALLLALATIGSIYWRLRTRWSLALAAVRDNTEAARSVGVDAGRMKWIVFLTSAFGTGVVGGLIYMQKGTDQPGCRVQRHRLDGLCPLYRRHRNYRGPDHRCAGVLCPAIAAR